MDLACEDGEKMNELGRMGELTTVQQRQRRGEGLLKSGEEDEEAQTHPGMIRPSFIRGEEKKNT